MADDQPKGTAPCPACGSTEHKGERRYVGGPLDGHVDRMVLTTPSDFPLTWEYPKHPAGIYERDLDGGVVATYRWRVRG